MSETMNSDLMDLTADVVAAFVSNNTVSAEELPGLIKAVHSALSGIGEPEAEPEPERVHLTPAQIRKSIRPDVLISFEDGKPYKTIKRHLSTRGMTIQDYKDKWGLPSDYPSVAPNYSEARSKMAKSLGLGRKPGTGTGKRGRPAKAKA